ncbi:MAG: SH3 domain-containing protein [Caldilineaceae bacterium]|nr:SH3 domain-containing protein [Caldilineaceae bacterium]
MIDRTQAVDAESLDVLAGSHPLFVRLSPILILFLMLWLLAGCGPSGPSAGTGDLATTTQEIARNFQADSDLARARAALTALDVPNANQLLLLETENAISAGDFANGDALTRLVLALGLTSSNIERYAQSRGLIAQAGEPIVQTVSQPAVAQSTGGEQAAAQPTATPADPTATPESATATPAADTPTPEPPTATPVTDPEVRTTSAMNVRGGPGTNYPVVGALNAGDSARITGKNSAGDWWQVSLAGGATGWVYAPLVTTGGNTGSVAVAEAPPAPPTATPVPVVVAQPTDTPVPAPAGVDFRLIERRIWGVEENGGHYSGDSVNCGDKQELHVIVLDAAGSRLNGVTVRGVYRNEFHVTGEKGPGLAQYDVNVDGDDIVVARDVDGRDVSSDLAKGLTAKTYNISHGDLMQGGFCRDAAGCDAFIKTNGCYGHFSWTVTFQRTY